ncbi:MAG: tetratricopeptide repeat protein [Calditrichaeota bacterium]|nr:tetratricopeptide repeat protein [Calditrichota bacterium]
MKDFVGRKTLTGLLIVAVLSLLAIAGIFNFGCVPTAQQQGPQISPERQKAIQDSLTQVYERKMALNFSLGYENYKNKMYSNAIPYFWKVAKLDTINKYKNLFTYLSDSYIKLNKADSAQIALEMGVQRFPNIAHLHRSLGYIYDNLGRIEEAIDQYEKALAIDEKRPADWKRLALLYIKNDQTDDAIRAYEKVVKLDPNDNDAQQTLSKLYKSTGNADAAIQQMESVKKLDPQNTENLFNLGKEYFNVAEYEKAISNFGAMLSLKPNDVQAMTYLASALQNVGNYKRAINIYKEVVKMEPDNKKIYTDIATCYKELKQFSTARKYANKALKIDNQYGLAYIVRAEIFEAAVDECMRQTGKDVADFDDKLVYELAYKEYKKATTDLQFKDTAQARLNYLKDFIPKKEDRFFHKGQTKPKKKCYSWIY